ncbi:MAG: guanylate kinase [Acidobacteriota bacterium]
MAPASDAATSRGELFILSAPSATGKTTLIQRLFDQYGDLAERLAFSVSHTTRPPRTGEVDGKHYYFVTDQAFQQMISEDAFVEWAFVHGLRYGTSRNEVERLLAAGNDVILDIDVQGAQQVLEQQPGLPSIFILPPSFRELERRLRSRALDDSEQIERRLVNATHEMSCYTAYQYVILNDELDRATEALAAIFLARRYRRDRMQPQIERVLEDL